MYNVSDCVLSTIELKALSVFNSLKFLLCVEFDINLCLKEAGSLCPIQIDFPSIPEIYKNLLSLAGARYNLSLTANPEGDSSLTGTPVRPFLGYHDYLPGGLLLQEVLLCLGINPTIEQTKKGKIDNCALYDALCTNYSQFVSDTCVDDVDGMSCYLLLDTGLSLPSYGHFVEVHLHKEWTPEDAMAELKEFIGWSTLDFRFYNPRFTQDGGVLVLPTVQDVCDIFEKYEDEDSDDEGDVLPFILRPVSSATPVPSLEESGLRKFRVLHWNAIVDFWKRFETTRNTIMIYNFRPQATLKEILAFVNGLPIESASLVEDESPYRKRRVFVTFATSDAAREALDLDGKNTKGRTLRAQVSPPYGNESRRGRVITSINGSQNNLASIKTRKEDDLQKKKEEKEKEKNASRNSHDGLQSNPATGNADVSTSPSLIASSVLNADKTKLVAPLSSSLQSKTLSPSMNASAKEFIPPPPFTADPPDYSLAPPMIYTPALSVPSPLPPAYEEVVNPQVVYITPAPMAVTADPKLGVTYIIPPAY